MAGQGRHGLGQLGRVDARDGCGRPNVARLSARGGAAIREGNQAFALEEDDQKERMKPFLCN